MIVEKYLEILSKLQKNPVTKSYKVDLAPIAVELLKLVVAEEKKEGKKK